jgi:hypothetical protein
MCHVQVEEGLNELRMLQRFTGHPNIVELIDHGSAPLPSAAGTASKQKSVSTGRQVSLQLMCIDLWVLIDSSDVFSLPHVSHGHLLGDTRKGGGYKWSFP